MRGSVNTSPRYATLLIVKWINIMRARRPDLPPFRQLSVEDVENCLNKGEFYHKKFKFLPKWVNISLCFVLQFSYPLLFKFFILHLPSSGADFFDNDCSLILLSRAL